MSTVIQLKNNLKDWIDNQLDILSKSNPVIKYSKPIIKRVLNKQIQSIDKYLSFITDENGDIDVEGIFNETLVSLKEPDVSVINTSVLGDIELGNGQISMNIPLTDKKIIFKIEDIEFLKATLIE